MVCYDFVTHGALPCLLGKTVLCTKLLFFTFPYIWDICTIYVYFWLIDDDLSFIILSVDIILFVLHVLRELFQENPVAGAARNISDRNVYLSGDDRTKYFVFVFRFRLAFSFKWRSACKQVRREGN